MSRVVVNSEVSWGVVFGFIFLKSRETAVLSPWRSLRICEVHESSVSVRERKGGG